MANTAFLSVFVRRLTSNYAPYPDGNVPRQGLYFSYRRVCDQYGIPHINTATLGKAIRLCFPTIKTRRLGVRGNSKYHCEFHFFFFPYPFAPSILFRHLGKPRRSCVSASLVFPLLGGGKGNGWWLYFFDRPVRSVMLIANFLFFVPVFHNGTHQIAGSAPPPRLKPNFYKIIFAKPTIRLRSGRSMPLGWRPSSPMARPKGRTARETMRKTSLRDRNPVHHQSVTRSIFQPRPRDLCLPRKRLPPQAAYWPRPRPNLPERFLPKPQSDGTRFHTKWLAALHPHRPFWEVRLRHLLLPDHPPLNCRAPSIPSRPPQVRSG